MRTAFLLACLSLTSQCAGQPSTPSKPGAASLPGAKTPAPAAADPARALREKLDSALKVLADNNDLAKSGATLDSLFEQAIAYAPEDTSLLADVAAARRMVRAVRSVEKEKQKETLAYLRSNPAVARSLCMLLREREPAKDALAVLEQLRGAHGDKVARYPDLTAAVCVVHDQQLRLESSSTDDPRSADPSAIFGYFIENEPRLVFPIRELAPELLVYMVDCRADIAEMQWALRKHAGDRAVGRRFGDLVYDTAHFKHGKPKKIEGHPYTLENLRKFGGICGDQAYFAAQTAKAIGVPSAEISGQNAEMGHAWVGFLQRRAGGVWFNCEEGHYDEYEKTRGTTRDPQTGRAITQSELELMARMTRTTEQQRHACVALIDAAARIGAVRAWPPPAPVDGAAVRLASNDFASRLGLLERAANICPANPEVWEAARGLASKMTTADRERWFRAVCSACDDTTPDFAYTVIASLISGISNPREQPPAWEWLAKQYPRRPDLACGALVRKGDGLLKSGDKDAAYSAYIDAAKQYINETPAAVASARRAEQMLRDAKRLDMARDMYKDIFRRTAKPADTRGFAGSNFATIGRAYAQVLEELGDAREAEQIRNRIKSEHEED
jgi:hypothetical protein